MTIEDKILKYIDNHDYVTYRELEVFFENSGIDWKGNLEIYSVVCDNVIFWSGWNEKVVSALLSLQSQGKIEKEPCDVITYILDGSVMKFPVVKKNINYKTPHWLPIIFRPAAKE